MPRKRLSSSSQPTQLPATETSLGHDNQSDYRGPDVLNDETIEMDDVARNLLDEQSNRQKRRKTESSGRGKGTKFLFWGTIAAEVTSENGTYKFMCKICDERGALNKGA